MTLPARFLLLGLLLCSMPVFAADGGYDFPYTDPLVATILGTPTAQKAPMVADIPSGCST